jgi:hypothetical protein
VEQTEGPDRHLTRNGRREYSGYPDVAVDKKGRATVVWTQPTAKGMVVRTVRSKGKGWTRPKTISAAGDFAGFADVEVSDRGHAVVHWAGDFPFGASDFSLLASYRSAKGRWDKPTRLDSQTPGFRLDARPESIAIDDRGVVTVAWDEIADSSDRIQVATRGPRTGWAQGTLAAGINLNAPAVATTPAGEAVVAWRTDDGLAAARRAASGAWSPAQQVVAGGTRFGHNLYGVGIARSGRVALYGREVQSRTLRNYVMIQDRPGRPWQRDYVGRAYRSYGFDTFLPEMTMSRNGAVAVTWNEQAKNPSTYHRTFVRVRTAAGRWKAVTRIGRATSNPDLGVDGKGRFSVVFGEGGCCTSLRYAGLGR